MAIEVKTKRRLIKEIEVVVANVYRETHDTTTLELFTGNDYLDYRPGHFLTINPHQFAALGRWIEYLQDMKGKKESPRAYSLASSPHESCLAITVKEEAYQGGRTKYPPLLSPVLVNRLKVGDKLSIKGFTGPYVLPEINEDQASHMLHLCAGSGIVPNWSMIKYCLEKDIKLRHTLILGNKEYRDIIYREELERLARENPDKLRVVFALSREAEVREKYGDNFVEGRIGKELIAQVVPDFEGVHAFVCGPGLTKYDKKAAKELGTEPAPRFFETALSSLLELGLEKSAIHSESYG